MVNLKSVVLSKRALAKALSVSFMDQMVSSATNFMVVFYLVHVMDKADFGHYSFSFALILGMAGLIASFIVVQFVVKFPDQSVDRRAEYILCHSVLVILMGFTLIIFSLLVSYISVEYLTDNIYINHFMLPIAIAAAFYALRDFLVRVAYSQRREFIVLFSSLAVTGGVFVCFGGLYLLNIVPTARYALMVYGLGQVVGCLAALALLHIPWWHFCWRNIYQTFTSAWTDGRWNVINNLVYTLRTQAHNFVVGPLLGAAALADVNAARVLVTPAVMAIPPFTQIFMPRLAERHSQGLSALPPNALIAIGGLMGLALFYVVILLVLLPWLLPLALGANYQHIGGLVLAWSVVTLLLAFRSGLTILLQVLGEFRNLLFVNSVVAVFAVLQTILLTKLWGAGGAIISLATAEALTCILLIFMLLRIKNGDYNV